MQKFLSNEQMRAADAHTINNLKVPSGELMRRAGRALADEVEKASSLYGGNIVVVCGGGNNGGDGYVCAAELASRGLKVAVLDLSDGKYSPDCAAARSAYKGAYTQSAEGDVVVDCIFGTGLCREVSEGYARVINEINGGSAYVVSADIPSGLNGDNGQILGAAVEADLTVAMGEYKLGHVLGDGPDCCGAVVRADIGIAAEGDYAFSYDDEEVAAFFPKRRRNTHKGSYGSACLIAGSSRYPGAAALCLSGALRSGCGYVKLSSSPEVTNALAAAYPQAIYLSSPDYSSQAMAIGPGCGDAPQLYSAITAIIRSYRGKLIIDADGINALGRSGASVLRSARCPVLVTPHVIEFSRLSGRRLSEIIADPVGCARTFASEYGVIVLLKGAGTVITDGKKVVLNLRGCTALSKGGSGDMLTGLISGTAARGVDLFDAAVSSAYIMGVAAEIAESKYTAYCAGAADIISCLPDAVKRVTSAAVGR